MNLTKSDRLNSMLFNMDIHTPFDVVLHLPYRYDDLTPSSHSIFADKEKVVVVGKIISELTLYNKNGFSIIKFSLENSKKELFKAVCYNRPYFAKTFLKGDSITLQGIYDSNHNVFNVINMIKGLIDPKKVLRPVYKLPLGYSNYQYCELVKRTFEIVKERICNDVPSILRRKYQLVDKSKALYDIHFPTNKEDIKEGLRYLKYEEALLFSLKTQLIKENNNNLLKNDKKIVLFEACSSFINNLPFKLTNDQIAASKEIINDLNKPSLMYRLLQGDVGSGKTVVSFVALFANFLRQRQGALMAPTDALAKQHFYSALSLFNNAGVNIALLTGSTSSKERKQILLNLKNGNINIIIGTHALFSDDVNYKNLGLVIIDEQHRFGVNQRLKLANKGNDADLLMMSATPIPRSLALSIYGDLDISSLNSFPSKTKNIKTKLLKSNDSKIYKGIDYILSQNRQVYIVAPLIDDTSDNRFSIDSLSKDYIKRYPGRVGVLHGKLTAKEKEEVLNKFYNNEVSILITTLVIEVGIDVKNASMIVIYDASNFGLASLHQLRGRIGRDGYPSYCFLTYDDISKDELNKLKILVNTLDGFEIAEQDLKFRGPGELTGLKQSGMPDFRFLNVYNDLNIFKLARDDAKMIISDRNNPAYKWVINQCEKMIIDKQN